MHNTKHYEFSCILLVVLAAAALVTSPHMSIALMLIGAVLIIYTIRDISDSSSAIFPTVHFLLACAFSCLAGNCFSALCLHTVSQNKVFRIICPPAVCTLCLLINGTRELPVLILFFIIVTLSGLAIIAANTMLEKYRSANDRYIKNVSTTAISEMYSKQLNQELIIKNYLTDKNARLEEREKISRSIHNSVGHSITAAIMTLEAADMLFDRSPERAREKMNAANERIRSSLDSIRHAVRVLDSETTYILIGDLIQAVTDAADEFMMDTMRKVHIDVHEMNNELSIPREHAEFLTGAFQELLSNGVRHGNADQFFLHLFADSTHIKMIVSDNGQSDFSDKNSAVRIRDGFGLKKLISYAEKCGGSAVFENRSGFRSEITLPFEKGENNGTA